MYGNTGKCMGIEANVWGYRQMYGDRGKCMGIEANVWG